LNFLTIDFPGVVSILDGDRSGDREVGSAVREQLIELDRLVLVEVQQLHHPLFSAAQVSATNPERLSARRGSSRENCRNTERHVRHPRLE
jgi:hypothetical protein